MLSLRPALIAACLPCLSAGAEGLPKGCPASTEDMARGVALAWDDGSTSTMKRDEKGMIVEVTRLNDGVSEDEFTYALHGYLTLKIGTPGILMGLSPDSHTFVYPPEIMAGGPIQPGETREMQVTVFSGGQGTGERQRLVAGPPGPLDIGGCVYDGYPVEVVYLDLDPQESDLFTYVPLLDTAFFRGAKDADGVVFFSLTPLSVHVLE